MPEYPFPQDSSDNRDLRGEWSEALFRSDSLYTSILDVSNALGSYFQGTFDAASKEHMFDKGCSSSVVRHLMWLCQWLSDFG